MRSLSGAEVEVGEEEEAGAEVLVLLLGGLLDLDDHVGEPPDVVGGADDLGAGGLEVVVGHGGEGSGVVLDEDFVACFDEGFGARWGDADAGFVVFHFPGYTDGHCEEISAFSLGSDCTEGREAAPNDGICGSLRTLRGWGWEWLRRGITMKGASYNRNS